MRFLGFASVCALCLVACGDKSAVSLTVVLDQASVTATDGPLGSSLSGSFRLGFQLGPEAPSATTVTLGNFALHDGAGHVLVDPLQVSASGASFPLAVERGATQTVNLTLRSSQVLAAPDRTLLCAGTVVIVGSVMDSSTGGTEPLQSLPFTPSCR